MRIEQLAYFQTVAKYQSMNLASEALFLTPQALSMAIKALEKELNVTLINRSYNGVTLTDTGREVLQIVEEMLPLYQKLKSYQDKPQATHSSFSGTMRIYATPLMNSSFIAPTIHGFLKDNPRLQMVIKEKNLAAFLAEIYELNFDLAMVHIPLNRLTLLPQAYLADFTFETIYSSKLAVICHKDHPLADKRMISWKMAREYPLLMVDENNLDDFALQDLRKKHGEPDNTILFPNIQLCLDGLINNVNAFALSFTDSLQYVNYSSKSQLRSIPLRENINMAILLVYSRKEPLSEASSAYLEGLRQFILAHHKKS